MWVIPAPRLIPCRVERRVNRFVVEAWVGGSLERVHNTNTGRLEELLVPGALGACIEIRGPRLRYRLVSVECCGAHALIDTRMQEEVLGRLIETGVLPGVRGCRVAGRAPRVGETRLDYLLDCGGSTRLVEVKSAVLRGVGGEAFYPDAPTERGRRHLRLLASLAERGYRPILVFIAGFPGARMVRPYERGDPFLPDALLEALEAGVEALGVGLYLEPRTNEIVVYDAELPVIPV